MSSYLSLRSRTAFFLTVITTLLSTNLQAEKKNVVVLVGPQGSGKTYIGKTMGRKPGITFLDVDSLKAEQPQGDFTTEEPETPSITQIHTSIDTLMERSDTNTVVIESRGPEYVLQQHNDILKQKYDVRFAKIRCSLPICLARLRKKGQQVSETRMAEPHELVTNIPFNWSLDIFNNSDYDETYYTSFLGMLTKQPAK